MVIRITARPLPGTRFGIEGEYLDIAAGLRDIIARAVAKHGSVSETFPVKIEASCDAAVVGTCTKDGVLTILKSGTVMETRRHRPTVAFTV